MGNCSEAAAYFWGLAEKYRHYEKHQQVLVVCQALKALTVDEPKLHLYRGEAEVGLGRTETAILSLQRASETAADDPDIALALGKMHHKLHQWQEAESVYKQALAASTDSVALNTAFGRLLMEQNRLDEAVQHLQKATQLDAEHGLTWLYLAQIYDAQRHTQRAIPAYQQALLHLPEASVARQGVQTRLERLNPQLPPTVRRSWSELTRRMAGPVLLCFVPALLNGGLRLGYIPGISWLGLLLASAGAFLWASSDSASQNPLICALVGEQGLTSATAKAAIGWAGAGCWLLALLLILLPFGRTLPEVPL
jgi:tetratricopeptide (TPR) repeat protein